MKHTEHNAFRSEAIDTINRIYKDNRNLTQLRWFLDTALSRFDNNSLNAVQPQVIVIIIRFMLSAEVSARRIGRMNLHQGIPTRSAAHLWAGLSIPSLI